MSKILYANGCSWTAGQGMPEDEKFVGNDYKAFAWPAPLGRMLNYNVVNQALGGGSNKRMVRMTCKFVNSLPKESYKDLLVVLGWTTAERNEIYINNEWYTFNAQQVFSEHNILKRLDKDIVSGIDRYQKEYVTYIENPLVNLLYYYQEKQLLSCFLESKGIKYLFSNSLPSHWGYIEAEEFQYQNYLANVKTKYMYDDITFNKYCEEENLLLSKCIHPLVEANESWADHLKEKITGLYGTL